MIDEWKFKLNLHVIHLCVSIHRYEGRIRILPRSLLTTARKFSENSIRSHFSSQRYSLLCRYKLSFHLLFYILVIHPSSAIILYIFDNLVLNFAILPLFSVTIYYYLLYLLNKYCFGSNLPPAKRVTCLNGLSNISQHCSCDALIIWQIFHFNMNSIQLLAQWTNKQFD